MLGVLKVIQQSSITACASAFRELGCVYEPAPPVKHVPRIERKIRMVQERVRCHFHELSYLMCLFLLVHCVYYSVLRVIQYINIDNIIPWENFHGRKLVIKLDFALSFGYYVQAEKPLSDSTMIERRHGAIALWPTGSVCGSWLFYSIVTGKTITRAKWTHHQIPVEVVSHLNQLARLDFKAPIREPMFELCNTNINQQANTVPVDEYTPSTNVAPYVAPPPDLEGRVVSIDDELIS